MTASQQRVLAALGRGSHTAVAVAQATDMTVRGAQKTLDALYRRSLVTISPAGRWCATERGRKKVAA